MRIRAISLFVVALTAFSSVAIAQVPRRTHPPAQSEAGTAPAEAHQAAPHTDPTVRREPFDRTLFGPDPVYPVGAYDPVEETATYGGKRAVPTPRPLLELGYPLYDEGPIGAGHDIVGAKNLVRPQFLVYGDLRTALAYNDTGGAEKGQVAARLNLEVDLKLTATERLHAFFRPLDNNARFTRDEFFGDDAQGGELILDGALETLFFEGDIGAIQSGLTDRYARYDLPIAFGQLPLFYQNGIWFDDAVVGVAFAVPARNSPKLDISNFDVSVFAGFSDVETTALRKAGGVLDEHGADVYGAVLFADAREGHLELGYGYLDDTRPNGNASYHSLALGWSRRYGGWLSNSVRLIANIGQDPDGGAIQSADGAVFLLENSLVTSKPSTLVPYANFFLGLDRPQPLARGNDGVLKNTGINFETDGLTGFPKLTDTAQDAWGGAVGVSYLFDLSRQVVAEIATVQLLRGKSDTIVGEEVALGARYQQNLSPAWLARFDAMYGFRSNADDIRGVRAELRRKF
ncbi:MAG: hypothetical protein RID42_01980 [Alphaproteobacteria bacterium]